MYVDLRVALCRLICPEFWETELENLLLPGRQLRAYGNGGGGTGLERPVFAEWAGKQLRRRRCPRDWVSRELVGSMRRLWAPRGDWRLGGVPE